MWLAQSQAAERDGAHRRLRSSCRSLWASLGVLAVVAILGSCSGGPPSGSGTSSGPAGQRTSATTYLPNIAYASASRSEETLDLSIPATGTGPYPLVILVHGGAFKVGDKLDDGPSADAAASLAKGYATASLNYRLSGEAIFPAAVQDVKAAIRFLRANRPAARLSRSSERPATRRPSSTIRPSATPGRRARSRPSSTGMARPTSSRWIVR
jgi:acetyl esterase/lipase